MKSLNDFIEDIQRYGWMDTTMITNKDYESCREDWESIFSTNPESCWYEFIDWCAEGWEWEE